MNELIELKERFEEPGSKENRPDCMNENSEYAQMIEEVGWARERGIITDLERETIYARLEAQLPEVQYFAYNGKWPVRGMFYENDVWVVAGDLIKPFGLPYNGENTLKYIPGQHRRYITGKNPHGKETFLCLDETGIKCLFETLVYLGY